MSAESSSADLEVRFACGHVEERRRRSPAGDDLALRSASRKLCVMCASAHGAERERMIVESILSGKEGLQVELAGSRKQINWAVEIRERWQSTIRRELPSDIQKRIEKARGLVSGQAVLALEQASTNVLAARLAAIADVLAHTKAAYWIEGRDGVFDYKIARATEDALRRELANLLTR